MPRHIKKRVLLGGLTVAIVGGAFLSGWLMSFAGQALAKTLIERVSTVENPIARTLLAKFLPSPNMLAEDHVRLSCEPNFSVKVFTQAVLLNATFVLKDTANNTVLYGPKVVDKIEPLWQTVPLGPMSYIPPKILVLLDAQSSDGKPVHDELILEPDCKKEVRITNLTNEVTILWPKGKSLFNPPPFDPSRPPIIDIPLTVAVPKEMLGQSLVTAVVWRDPNTLVKHYTSAEALETIPTEIVQLNLHSVSPITVRPREDGTPMPVSSFFDVFVEIGVGQPAGSILPQVIREGALGLPEVSSDDRIVHPDGRESFIAADSFFDVFVDITPLRLIDATPLERTTADTASGDDNRTPSAETSDSFFDVFTDIDIE